MTEHPLNPAEEALRQLINDTDATHRFLDALIGLTAEQRQAHADALRAGHRAVQRRIRADRRHHLTMAAAALDAPPAVVAATLDDFTVWRLRNATVRTVSPLDFVVDHVTARGRDWVEQFVAAVVKKPTIAETASPVVDPLLEAFQLPLPTAPRYWVGWVRDGATPGPDARWQERFIAACAVPNAFAQAEEPKDQFLARIGNRLRYLRRCEPTNDAALLGALVQVFERGDRAKAQRVASWWFEALGLEAQVAGMRQRIVAALSTIDSAAAAVILPHLLSCGLPPQQLGEVAVALLPRTEKKLKRAVLAALRVVGPLSPEVTHTVAAAATGADVALAREATEVLDRWGGSVVAVPEAVGLWRDPVAAEPERLPEPTPLDDAALAELLTRVSGDDGQPGMWDEVLGALTSTAHARGAEAVRQAVCEHLGSQFTGPPLLRAMLVLFAHRPASPPIPPAGPLSFLMAHHARDVLERLGQLPCLLSVPSHSGYRVSWAALAERVARYHRAGTQLLPTDVAIALARIRDATQPEGLGDLTVPIRGVTATLDDVIRTWRDAPANPGRWKLTPRASLSATLAGRPSYEIPVSGDVPASHAPLNLRSAWSLDFRPDSRWRSEDLVAYSLAPQHPTRPAARVLRTLMAWGPAEAIAPFEVLLAATRWAPIVGVLTFAMAAESSPKLRDRVAAGLLGAWEDGRVNAVDLVVAWNDERRPVLMSSLGKVFATLEVLAEAGALALVWPLMARIADEQCAVRPVPGVVGGMLERLLVYLSEVAAPVDLPHVAALAARKSKSKAVTVARLLVERCGTVC